MQLVPSLTQNVAGHSLLQFSGISGKQGREPVFFWFSDPMFKEAVVRKNIAVRCALNESPDLTLGGVVLGWFGYPIKLGTIMISFCVYCHSGKAYTLYLPYLRCVSLCG